jgi:hypothetical protein
MKRNRTAILIVAVLLGTGLITARAEEEKSEVKKQTVCPVMGGKINKAQYADVNGYRIYVCCPGCIGKVKADPDTYIKKMEAEGIVIEKTPEKAKQSEHDHEHGQDHDH